MTAPKEIGRLGLGSLKAINLSLITKWIWRLKVDSSGLWCTIIKGIHNLYNKPAHHISKKSIPGIWNRIAGVQDELKLFDIDIEELMVKKKSLLKKKSNQKYLFYGEGTQSTIPYKL